MIAFVLGLSAASAQTLPDIKAETVAGAAKQLPGDLAESKTVMVLSFQKEHRETSNAWRPHLSKLAASPEIDWLEVAFIDLPYLATFFTSEDEVRKKYREGLTDSTTREHVAIVFDSADSVTKAFSISDTSKVAVVVVDKSGKMTFKASGGPSDANVGAIKKAVQ